MPRLPRDLSGRDLARALRHYGYEVTRETGSHLRLTTGQGGEHRVTIPDRASLRIGPPRGILADVAAHLKLERRAFIAAFFERGIAFGDHQTSAHAIAQVEAEKCTSGPRRENYAEQSQA